MTDPPPALVTAAVAIGMFVGALVAQPDAPAGTGAAWKTPAAASPADRVAARDE